jgi:hypothetical protein
MRTPLLVILIASLAPLNAGAETFYKGRAPDGSVIYSDEAFPGAEQVELEPVPTYAPAPSVQAPFPAARARPPGSTRLTDYDRVSIRQPADDSAFWSSVGEVPVLVATDPPFAPDRGHRIQPLLDGRPAGPLRSNAQFTLTQVERGSHTLQVQMVDQRGTPIGRSAPIIFHLHRPSRLNRP